MCYDNPGPFILARRRPNIRSSLSHKHEHIALSTVTQQRMTQDSAHLRRSARINKQPETNNVPTHLNMNNENDLTMPAPGADYDYEITMASIHQPGVCKDQNKKGHADPDQTHECRDPNHDTSLSKVSCQQCVARAEGYCPLQSREIYKAGLSIQLHPGCHAAWQDVDGKDSLCNCRALPRCGICHMRNIRTFKDKATEIDAEGAAKRCARCKEELDQSEAVFVRCAVCLGTKTRG